MIFYPAISCTAPKPGYTLVWADEFNDKKLDMDKWDYYSLGPRRDAINVKDTVHLDGKGNLVLTTKKVGDKYHSAMISTRGKFEAKFGYFECRVNLQEQPGHWSAFWLQSPTISKVGDPRKNGTEIDIFEYLFTRPGTLHHNLHWDGYGKDHKHTGSKSNHPNLQKGFHVIALEWTPDEYLIYVDGKEAWRTNQALSHVKQFIILSLEVGKWAGNIAEAELPDRLYVDYVRVYQRKKDMRDPPSGG
jgi:beta-glucanase (GH16 family)